MRGSRDIRRPVTPPPAIAAGSHQREVHASKREPEAAPSRRYVYGSWNRAKSGAGGAIRTQVRHRYELEMSGAK